MEEIKDHYVAKMYEDGTTFIQTPNRCPVTPTQALALLEMWKAAEPNANFVLLVNQNASLQL